MSSEEEEEEDEMEEPTIVPFTSQIRPLYPQNITHVCCHPKRTESNASATQKRITNHTPARQIEFPARLSSPRSSPNGTLLRKDRERDKISLLPPTDRDNVLAFRRLRQNEYAKRHREKNRAAINAQERLRRRKAKELKRSSSTEQE
ncbi:hypothetical protein VNI00_016490 [Paramarasmius palmivorus]|uniref:BZIP domain-containing protein n=1 Tax=Paramarasmius palmivorus TaxID=297713 RepID=A0AAW0BF50_9AGAR